MSEKPLSTHPARTSARCGPGSNGRGHWPCCGTSGLV